MTKNTKVINLKKFYRVRGRCKPASLVEYNKYGVFIHRALVDINSGYTYVHKYCNTGEERMLSSFYRYLTTDIFDSTLEDKETYYVLT